jgi:putative intracellular protease/amidase
MRFNRSPKGGTMSLQDPNVVNPARKKRVAIVIANPATSTTTGWPVGFWWSELTHAYYLLTESGYETEVFSPDGGSCKADSLSDPRDSSGYSASDLITMGFIATPSCAVRVENTRPVTDIDVDRFDAILVAGGQAPMFTFDTAADLHRKFVEFYERGKLAVALCHGVAILKYARLSNGNHLATGKTVTGFANVEEDFADNAVWDMNLLSRDRHVMPWRIEDEMKRIGANFVHAGLWRAFAIRDGNLITGQQNFSGAATAEVVVQALGR